MPSPSSSLATQRPDLAASFQEFDLEMQRRGYIASRVLPVVEVAQQSGNFGKIPVEQLLNRRQTRRAPGGGYNRGSFTFESAKYSTSEHGVEEAVDDREAESYRHYFDAEQIVTARAFESVLGAAEDRASAAIFDTGVWTGSDLTTSVTNEWDDAANATPISDVEAAVQAVWANSGLWPNALVVTRHVFRNLRLTQAIQDAIASSGAGFPTRAADITVQQLAAAFDLDHIIVANAAKNTAAEGQSASIAPVWDDEFAMVCRVATSQDMREPCIGRTFHWAGDGSDYDGLVETYRDETVRGDIVRVRHDVDEQILYPQAGHLLSNITT